ncbi:MAG: NADase-type glycan-binding domain-containing protein, partial [Actinomycetales bacterium]
VHFCDWCGTPMSGVQLAPKTQVILEAAGSNPKKKKRKRGPTRNWRSTGPAILIVFAVIGALAFAFFGPGAFQSRLSITRVIQSVSQWVNPMVGRAAKIAQVTATSSLPGTTPESLDTVDASTFWASAISSTMGANSELTFTFDTATEIDRMVIMPGIQNKIFGRSAVAYPRIVALTFDDGSQVEQSLAAIQSDEDLKQLVQFPARTTKSVKLKINAVYLPVGYQPGDYGTVAISGVEFMEPPQPPTVFGVQNQGLRKPGIPGVPSTS